MKYAALLRGINVGGRNKVPMAELRAALEAAGFDGVATYIQSGNIVFDAKKSSSEPKLAQKVASVVQETFGLEIPVVIRNADTWASAMANNPFPDHVSEPKFLHVFFCDTEPESEAVNAMDTERFVPDEMVVDGQEIFVWYADGVSKSKLTGAVLERNLGVTATARNWSSVLKLNEMLTA